MTDKQKVQMRRKKVRQILSRILCTINTYLLKGSHDAKKRNAEDLVTEQKQALAKKGREIYNFIFTNTSQMEYYYYLCL